MTSIIVPQSNTFTPARTVGGTTTPEERLADRFNAINAHFIEPAIAELEKVYAYCVQEAEVDEIPLTGLNPYDFGTDVALARRETEIASDLREFMMRIRTEYMGIRERATRSLPLVSRQEQFAAMLAQARESDFGVREEFAFSPENRVTIDVGMVQEAGGFYAALVQVFVEQWEREIDGVWEGARAAGRPAPDISQLPPVRLSMQPSFAFFTSLPSIPLNRTDALTLAAIGMVLGLWECYPGPEDQAPDGVPGVDLPIVIALPHLLEAAGQSRRAAEAGRTNPSTPK
ncbi:MAG: hypothetical protein ACR2M1_04250 [Gemmatimonadaceae bacterium]